MSGNIHDSAPLNNIQRFGPEYVKDKESRTKSGPLAPEITESGTPE